MASFKTSAIALAIVGSAAAAPALAAPVASAVSVVSFENFTISWNTLNRQVDAATDFSSLSVTSSQLTAANMTGLTGVSDNPSSTNGASFHSTSQLGSPAPGLPTSGVNNNTMAYPVPALPMVGNFSLSASNEDGSPIKGFGVATQNHANLHNSSYASLDTLNGSAGTSSSSQLASTMFFVSAVNADSLHFAFDLGKYIGAFLSAGAFQSASASWDVNFSLFDTTTQTSAGGFALGDSISNNAPGSGATSLGTLNSTLTGGLVDLSPFSFNSAAIRAGDRYQLTATISTRTQVERKLPEPTGIALVGLGLVALGIARRKQKQG